MHFQKAYLIWEKDALLFMVFALPPLQSSLALTGHCYVYLGFYTLIGSGNPRERPAKSDLIGIQNI